MPALPTSGLRVAATLFGAVCCSMAFSQWHQLNGPEGGSVPTLNSIDNDIFAVAGSGSIHRSVDSGAVWSTEATELTRKGVTDVRKAGDVLLAGTVSDGMWYSTDDGGSWSASAGLPAGTNVHQIVINGDSTYLTSDH